MLHVDGFLGEVCTMLTVLLRLLLRFNKKKIIKHAMIFQKRWARWVNQKIYNTLCDEDSWVLDVFINRSTGIANMDYLHKSV